MRTAGRRVRPGNDDGGATWVLQGRAVQLSDREAVCAGRGLLSDHGRAAPGSRHHRPVRDPAREGAGRVVQRGPATAGCGGRHGAGMLSLDGTKLTGNAARRRTGRCRRSSSCLPRRPKPMPLTAPARRHPAVGQTALGVRAAGKVPQSQRALQFPGATGRPARRATMRWRNRPHVSGARWGPP
jgi:hypothetical protein